MPNDSINTVKRNPLLLVDLFECVLEWLVTEFPRTIFKEERRTLAVLARTCRTFSEPSLNLLWRCLDSLLPLVRCFSDVADEARVKTPPSHIEWLAINRYSPRIRELTLGNEPLSLQFLQCTGLVLPNLRAVRWKYSLFPAAISEFRVDSIVFLWPSLSPNIVTLDVLLKSPDDPNYHLFLENYLSLCPNLKSLKLKFHSWLQEHKAVSQALSRAICSNADWRHVELSPSIDNVVLRHLGGCPNLKTLSLALAPQTSRPDEAFFGPEDTPFCNVSDIRLKLWNPLDVAVNVSALLAAFASPRHLQSIRLVHDVSSELSSNITHDQPLSYETFRPLASLVHLRRLFIDVHYPTSLDDEEFSDLVRNWPFLEALQMTWLYGGDSATSITLRGLLSLLASCRELRAISLTLDARNVPVAGTYADVCYPSITSRINFRNSPITHPDLVARFLLRHLPSMRRVSSSTWFAFNVTGDPTAAASNADRDYHYDRLWCSVHYMSSSSKLHVWIQHSVLFGTLKLIHETPGPT